MNHVGFTALNPTWFSAPGVRRYSNLLSQSGARVILPRHFKAVFIGKNLIGKCREYYSVSVFLPHFSERAKLPAGSVRTSSDLGRGQRDWNSSGTITTNHHLLN